MRRFKVREYIIKSSTSSKCTVTKTLLMTHISPFSGHKHGHVISRTLKASEHTTEHKQSELGDYGVQ